MPRFTRDQKPSIVLVVHVASDVDFFRMINPVVPIALFAE
jgi:hypothetical protein